MSTDAAAAFTERLKTDAELAARLARAQSPEQRLAIARAAGYDLTAEDLRAVSDALGVSDVPDEELEDVVGGLGAAPDVTMTTPD